MTQASALIGFIISSASLAYLTAAVLAVRAWGSRPIPRAEQLPPVTILKPLCGDEALLYENLRSFCDQDYPDFQVVFGVRDGNDPAIAAVRRLIAEFPDRKLELVIDGRIIGANLKVSNLANMMTGARHDRLVIADSDIRVGRDYLRCLVGPLEDPAVGLVTCLYRARPHGSIWSRLGAQFVNEWFLPSVLVSRALGSTAFGFGATLALRRPALEAIGGFAALADYLADDYMLGALTRRRGLRTVLSPYLVETLINEPEFTSLLAHELRWMRTIRIVQPWGHAGAWLTHAFPVTLAGAALIHSLPWSLALPVVALILRAMLYSTLRSSLHLSQSTTLWLVPLRDVLSFIIWSASFLSRRVIWRQQGLSVQASGRMAPDKE